MTPSKILISGHRNPDIDSLASAYALAALRQAQADAAGEYLEYEPICPGILSDRGQYLFKRFGVTPPRECHDVFVRMQDLMQPAPSIHRGSTVYGALKALRSRNLLELPIVNGYGKFVGMFNSLSLLKTLLNLTGEDELAFSSRIIYSSLELICKVLKAKPYLLYNTGARQTFEVYVASMRASSLAKHLPDDRDNLIVITGDNPDNQRAALECRTRLLVITGNVPPEADILERAEERGISVVATALDSASVIRQLKFSMPVEYADLETAKGMIFSPTDRVKDYQKQIMRSSEELWPVVSPTGILEGVVYKEQLMEEPPFKMILVDHNEPGQFLAGVEELPIIEVIDHHRISMFSTETPLRFTGDIVGSTCTIVARMYRESSIDLSPKIAGILLCGLVSDTLNLRSPTTSDTDREICRWLEQKSGVRAADLMSEIMAVGSALAKKTAEEVISGDRKDYVSGEHRFALAQVEEAHLELLHNRREEILKQMQIHVDLEKLAFFGLLVTDAEHEMSQLLICGRADFIRTLPYEKVEESIYALPGVLSRKKQLLPQILSRITYWQNM
ncbi:MAG: putative manganese-dependent inorganic diphosphatase [Opitutales bacterium]|nr:putative manganese-dependent inorganic diphosphatase [Opitutales bacterium]